MPFSFDTPTDAIHALVAEIRPTDLEQVELGSAGGRVLGQAVLTDRPSPACDVSGMDGYAVRLADLASGSLPVVGEISIGQPPPEMPTGAALRIFTGSPVPAGCDAVIPREHLEEQADLIRLPASLQVRPGQNIRRRGENAPAGQLIVHPGTPVRPTVAALLAACGVARPSVHRRVRVGSIVTGNEVFDVNAAVEPWQLRDSNGATLTAFFSARPWIQWRGVRRASDHRQPLRDAIAASLADCDAIVLTGGVSMGNYDFVPSTLAELGCRIVFHQLPIRPGKPILGGIGPQGQLVLSLPGNPVSVMTTGRRIALPALRRLAGFASCQLPVINVTLANPDDARVPLHWSRPVRLLDHGLAELLPSRGSGDLVAAARSDGFIELPPDEAGPGPWPFHAWGVTDE